ncbi:MAG: Uma2 family endonuclease [Gammaproteobacteria bacterium]|nr:Uma2 family endonuclease [Gammaproteobacteria bacterium]
MSWYFRMMRSRRPKVQSRAAAADSSPAPEAPLSVRYADALYRPVPPVEYDDEGYPGPDGKRPESTRHEAAATNGVIALRSWFCDQPETLVARDLLMLFEEGTRSAALAPDLMVVFDAGNPDRSSYKVWREGDRVPAFALEVLSTSTRGKDLRAKPALYAALGVHELWLFEPIKRQLVGYRLEGDRYDDIRSRPDGSRPSRVLGLDVLVEDGQLRFRNPDTGEFLPDHGQSESQRREERGRRELAEAQRDQAEAQREEERRRREQAERRIEELEAQLARLG